MHVDGESELTKNIISRFNVFVIYICIYTFICTYIFIFIFIFIHSYVYIVSLHIKLEQ